MAALSRSRPVRRWLRRLGWLSFALLALVFLASIGHWWLSRQAHAVAERARSAVPKRPAPLPKSGAASGAEAKAATPVAQVPLIGALYSGDALEVAEYEAKEKELRRLTDALALAWTVDGISFVELLKRLGEAVPDGTTEAQAAAIFLRKAEALKPLVGEWKAALAAQPWDFAGIDLVHLKTPHDMEVSLVRLLGALTEASWLTGDAEGARSHWQTLMASVGPLSQPESFTMFFAQGVALGLGLDTFRTGVSMGTWTNEELASFPEKFAAHDRFAQLKASTEGEKQLGAARLNAMRRDPLGTLPDAEPRPVWQDTLIQLTALLTTEQRLQDNVDVMKASMDALTAPFDAVNNRYLPHDSPNLLSATRSSSWFESYYYVYAAIGVPLISWLDERVVREQTGLNQATIAAQLELQKRTTGSYPATLPSDSPNDPVVWPRPK